MTTPAFCTEQSVRDILSLNGAATSQYGSDLIGSNIRDASWFLERATQRIFRDEPTLTLKFTTNNKDSVYLPGLRSVAANGLALNGAVFTADESYWLVPDAQQTGVYLAVSFHPFGSYDYRSNPEWFDRNMDSPKWQATVQDRRSLPNDLVINGAWGYADANLPEPVRRNAARLAAWYTIRSDALLSGARATETGIFDLSHLPVEVQEFVASWKSGPQAVGI